MQPTLFAQWRDMLIEIDSKIPNFTTTHGVLIGRLTHMIQMYAITQQRLQEMFKEM